MHLDLSMFSPRARPLVGLDISSAAVKMVELAGDGKGGYRVERHAVEFLSRDAISEGNIANLDAVTDGVRRAWKRLATPTRHVAMALPASAVITKKISVPAGLREGELEIQVEAEANQYIPFAIDEVNLDYQVLGPAPSAPDDLEVLIAVSRKDRVEDRVAVAEAAGLKVAVMDVDSYASLAAFSLIERQLPENARNRVVTLVDVGAHAMRLTVLRNGELLYAREQAFGGAQLTQDISRHFGMDYEEAEAAKRAGSLPADFGEVLLAPFLDNLSLEVSRALQFFFTSTHYAHADHLVLAGGCALLPGLAEVVATRTGIDTRIANPFAGMAVSDRVRTRGLQADAPSLMVACGLALRRFDTP